MAPQSSHAARSPRQRVRGRIAERVGRATPREALARCAHRYHLVPRACSAAALRALDERCARTAASASHSFGNASLSIARVADGAVGSLVEASAQPAAARARLRLVAASGGRATSDGFAVGSTLELVRRAEEGSAPQLFVHTLDALLLPPSLRTVHEELLLDGSFASFLHACDGAGLGWVLSAVGPLTVLAVDESGFSTGLGARINTSLVRGEVDAAREGLLRSAHPRKRALTPRGFRRCTCGAAS